MQQQQPAQGRPPPAVVPERPEPLTGEVLDRPVEFVPFMAKDPIRLSARMVLQYLCVPTRSGKICDEKQAIRFIMLCKARGLNPWEGDAFLIGYDSQKHGPQFNLVTAHQAFLKRAEVHPDYDGMESGVLVQRDLQGPDGEVRLATVELAGDFLEDGDKLVGGWAKVHFKGRSHPMYKRLKLETFNTGYSRWEKDPAGMIVKCAEADALRSAFPNSLGGMYLEGELAPPREAALQMSPPPARGRHQLRNGNGAKAAEPDPAGDALENERQNVLADLGERLQAAESLRDLVTADAEAAKHVELLGPHAWSEWERRRQERQAQLLEAVPTREPGEED